MLTKYEQMCLEKLLAGEDPVLNLLREQSKKILSVTREHTGVGEYLHFSMPDDVDPIPGNPSITFGDLEVECEDEGINGGVILQVRQGLITTMESFSYDETWPQKVGRFSLKYMSGETRDLTKLRQTPGWI